MSKVYIEKLSFFNQDIDLNNINPVRKEYLLKLNNDSLKRSYYAWILLKEMVLKEYNLNIDKLNLYYNEYKKPYFKEFNFNISHSNNLIAVAISDTKIGVDIQYLEKCIDRICWDKSKDITSLAKKINCSTDYYDFYKTFSAKEAISKKQGTGLVLSKLSIKEDINHQEIIVVDNLEYVLSISSTDYIEIKKPL